MAGHLELIVVGLGAMGAAALYQAAKRGPGVLGIDQFRPPHHYGSSHGDTRITRQAIGEGEVYMPFLRRSNEIWQELETVTASRLFIKTGGLIIAPQSGGAQFHAHGDFVGRTARIAAAYKIEHVVLSAKEVIQRFPNVLVRPHEHAYYEPEAGILRPERCIEAQLIQAQRYGATIRFGERVTDYKVTSQGVQVFTDKATYKADKLILAAGPWIVDLLQPEFRPGLKVYRQVIYWFAANDIATFFEGNFPFLIWIGDTRADFFSVFPTPFDGLQGVKVLTEQYLEAIHPNGLDRVVQPTEVAHMYHELTKARLEGVKETLLHADVCMYTVTPDEDFIIDCHPESDRVVIASSCSGHGFKHSPAVGEALVELALEGTTTLDISAFKLARLWA